MSKNINLKYNPQLIRKNIYETSTGRVPQSSDKIGYTTTYRINLSYDKFKEFLSNNDIQNIRLSFDIVIYDESYLNVNINFDLILKMLQKLNSMDIHSITFNLSDDMLYHYNKIMNEINWKHKDKTKLNLTIDRHPTNYKPNELNIQIACGNLTLTEDKLIWFSNSTLLKLYDRVPKKIIDDTIKLKNVVNSYYEALNQQFYIDHLSDYEKFLLTYIYFKNHLKISYTSEYTFMQNGKVKRIPNTPKWIEEAYGTYKNKKGVCLGQAKLMNILLSNPLVRVDSSVILGENPLGSHAWVGANIDNTLYECCTTMKGIYKDLKSDNYLPEKDNIYTRVYPRSYLNDQQINNMIKHIQKLKK